VINNRATVAPLLIDVRSREAYDRGHIPGAVSLPVRELNGQGKDKRNLAPVVSIEASFRAAGIRMNLPVVIYDDAVDHRPAARVFWALEVHGHPSVAVMNGGLPAWLQTSDEPLEKGTTAVEPSDFVAILEPRRLATSLQVLRASTTGTTRILDTRSLAEYVGEESSASRFGHIPGAQHIDFNAAIAPGANVGQCKMNSIEELSRTYTDLPEGPVIAYCNSGNRASVTYLALRLLGHDVAVYDGGWREWAENPKLPISIGAIP